MPARTRVPEVQRVVGRAPSLQQLDLTRCPQAAWPSETYPARVVLFGTEPLTPGVCEKQMQ